MDKFIELTVIGEIDPEDIKFGEDFSVRAGYNTVNPQVETKVSINVNDIIRFSEIKIDYIKEADQGYQKGSGIFTYVLVSGTVGTRGCDDDDEYNDIDDNSLSQTCLVVKESYEDVKNLFNIISV